MPDRSHSYYDSASSSFVEIGPGRKTLLYRVGAIATLVSLLVAVGIGFLSQVGLSPVEVDQREEIEHLRSELRNANERLTSLSDRLERLAETDRELYRTILEAEPISEEEFQMGVGGAEASDVRRYSGSSNRLMRRTSARLAQLERQVALQERSYGELIRLAAGREDVLRQQPAILPVQGGRLASGFGMRYHPILRVVRMHSGVDFAVPSGTPVHATGDGVVRLTGTEAGYGLTVEVEHPETEKFTRYAHLSRVEEGIRPGTHVERGEVIAYSGNSGLSTAPHLHYEVRRLDVGETALDPVGFFAPAMTPGEFLRVRKISQARTASFD